MGNFVLWRDWFSKDISRILSAAPMLLGLGI